MKAKSVMEVFGILFFINILENIIILALLDVNIDRTSLIIIFAVSIISTALIKFIDIWEARGNGGNG